MERVNSPLSPLRLGVLGGTFDPPHYGHLQLAQAAGEQLRLHRVLWVLTAEPPHKLNYPLSSVADRLAMVQALIANYPTFELSRVDIDRPGPHWTADSLALLAQQYPGARLVYLMGSDSLNSLPEWNRAAEFLRYVYLGIMCRPGSHVALERLERSFPGITSRLTFLQAPPLTIASRDLRRRIADNEPLDGLTSAAVIRLIQERQLYKARQQ